LQAKLGGGDGVNTVDPHAKQPPPPKNPAKPTIKAARAEAAKTAKAAKAGAAGKKPRLTLPFSSDLGDLVFGGLREGLLKGLDCTYNYTDDDSGDSIAYRAKLGINASALASQKVAGLDNRVMGRDWVKCFFPADKQNVWRHFTRSLYNSDEVPLTHCTHALYSYTVPMHCTHALYPCTVPMHLLQEGGWSICETKGAKAVLKRLQEDGVPNKGVDEHFKDTKKKAAAKRRRS
jgi:hypothetical protein